MQKKVSNVALVVHCDVVVVIVIVVNKLFFNINMLLCILMCVIL